MSTSNQHTAGVPSPMITDTLITVSRNAFAAPVSGSAPDATSSGAVVMVVRSACSALRCSALQPWLTPAPTASRQSCLLATDTPTHTPTATASATHLLTLRCVCPNAMRLSRKSEFCRLCTRPTASPARAGWLDNAPLVADCDCASAL